MIRTLATLANLALLGALFILLSMFGLPSDPEDVFLLLTGVSAPVLSLVAIYRQSPHASEESTLALARKALRAKLRKAAE